jgi:hypothetical protein
MPNPAGRIQGSEGGALATLCEEKAREAKDTRKEGEER